MADIESFPRLSAWRAGGRSFPFVGHEIFYRDSAGRRDDEILLLLHGFPTSSWDWQALWEPLSRRFRVVAPDFLGFGFSAKPRAARYTIGVQADLIESLLAHLGVARTHLLAHDYGDTVAQELLARQAERTAADRSGLRIASACLLNGGLFPETHRARLIQKVLASKAGPIVVRLMNRGSFDRSFAAIFGAATKPGPDALAEYWAIVTERDGHLLTPKIIGYMKERQTHRERWLAALRSESVPIRLIAGMDDPVSGAHMVRRYRELISPADVVELAGIGHYPQCEAPDAVFDAVTRFHDRLSAIGDVSGACAFGPFAAPA